jgi:D-glycero-D-manno-heptose 1,7-bisphosphate phosphatase
MYSEADFHALMEWMRAELEREQVRLDGVYFCPYHPEHGVGEYRREHDDRKPGPGMLLRAAREHGLDLAQSVMVGDRCSDVAAANAAGLRNVFLLRGTAADEGGTVPCPGKYMAIGSLAEAEWWIREMR